MGAIDGSTTPAPYALVELDRRTGHNVTVRLGGGSAIDGVGLPPDGGAAWVSDVTGGASIVPGPAAPRCRARSRSARTLRVVARRQPPRGRPAAGVDVYTVADGTVVGVPGVHAEHLSWSR